MIQSEHFWMVSIFLIGLSLIATFLFQAIILLILGIFSMIFFIISASNELKLLKLLKSKIEREIRVEEFKEIKQELKKNIDQKYKTISNSRKARKK